MYDLKKSDVAIVAVKQANKGRKRSAESVEPRAAAEGNSEGRSMNRAQKRGIMSQEADRIRQAVKRNPKECLVSLFHHITVPVLSEAFYSLKSDVAAGVDGVTWEMYAEGLGDHLTDLHGRLHRGGAYRAPPVRRVEIPKPDGGKRPLGIATLEDKIVQKAVTDTILVPIYESEFLGFNYGFRPGRGAHNALDALTVGIERCKINWVLDADVRAFFDTVNRDWLVRFLEHRIGDKRVIRLISKWLNAGVMDGTDWTDTGKGVPQGAVVSPVLSNVYLHNVFDLWAQQWRKRKGEDGMIVVRYADDFVVGFQRQWEAESFLKDLKERLAKFGLDLHPDKTRLIEFGRFAKADRKRRGQGKPETFDFMGMTHYCVTTRRGKFRVGRKPSRKRVGRTLRRIWEALRMRMHLGEHEVAIWLGRVIKGWLNYYAVPGTSRTLANFVQAIRRMLMRTLRRRSQRDRYSWPALDRLIGFHWPKPTIRHPWPSQRLIVNTRGRSRMR